MAELTPPLQTNPDELVENVFPLDPTIEPSMPDILSRSRFSAFLLRRFEPDQQGTKGGWRRAEVTTAPITHIEHTGTFFWGAGNKRRFWAGLAAVNLLFNAGYNTSNLANVARDGIELVQDAKDGVEDLFGVGAKCETNLPGSEYTDHKTSSIETFVELQKVGSSEPSQAGIQNLANTLLSLRDEGKDITSLSFRGSTSDEWRSKKPDIGLGAIDKENAEQLAPARLNSFMEAFGPYASSAGIDVSKIKTSYSEAVLSEQEIADVDAQVKLFGFKNIDEALGIYNAYPDTLPVDLENTLNKYFGNERGVHVTIDYEETTLTRTPGKHVKECTPDGSPDKHHDYNWRFLPIPLVPLPKFGPVFGEKVKNKWVYIPPEVPDPEFLLLHPKAVAEDGKLVKDAWAYTRKYQNLMREDDRIKSTYNLEYVDEDGEPQNLRAMFIDHEPSEESVEMIAGLFQKISQMQGGRVGRELNMLAVYPHENAGLHDEPKKVGLGQEIQRVASVQGIAYPSLRLVEMHMPAKPTPDQLQEFEGAQWTISHEIAGHFTDLNEDDNHLNQIAIYKGVPVYLTNNRFENSAQADYERSAAEERAKQPLTWQVRRGVENLDGEVVERTDVVDSDDPRLREGLFIRIGRFVSRYSRAHAAEHYAESAAQVTTGIGVPLMEEPETWTHQIVPEAGHAYEYAASQSMHNHLTDRWGSAPEADNLEFPNEAEARGNWSHRYSKLTDDPDLFRLAEEARSGPLPPNHQLIHIFTGTRIEDKQDSKK